MEEDSTMPLLLSLTYYDNDMLVENRDSVINIINVTGRNNNDEEVILDNGKVYQL